MPDRVPDQARDDPPGRKEGQTSAQVDRLAPKLVEKEKKGDDFDECHGSQTCDYECARARQPDLTMRIRLGRAPMRIGRHLWHLDAFANRGQSRYSECDRGQNPDSPERSAPAQIAA